MNKLRNINNGWIIIVFVALTASTFWTIMSLQTTLETASGQSMTVTASSDYEVVSREATLVWPAGTVFEPDNAAYFYATNPQMTITPNVVFSGMLEGTLKGTLQTQVKLQAVNDKSLIYWSYTLEDTNLQPFQFSKDNSSSPEHYKFSGKPLIIEVPTVYELVKKIGEELDFKIGTYQISISSTIRMTGTVNHQNMDELTMSHLTAALQPSSFMIDTSQRVTEKVIALTTPTETLSVQDRVLEQMALSPFPIGISIALAVLLVILLVVSRKTNVIETIDHKRFKEWITEGRVAVNDWIKINILTLEGLVDLAIDLDKRVIYDSSVKKYFVLADEMVYVYDSASVNSILENRPQLGKLLIERSLLRPEQLETGLYYQQKVGSRLGESLIALGFIGETTLYSVLAAQQNIDYFEINPDEELTETSWLLSMNIGKAKALQVLPLGRRGDGKWVVASSDPSKAGIQKTLEEILGDEVFLVAARPSVIYETLDRLAEIEKHRLVKQVEDHAVQPYERLSQEEVRDFNMAYIRGNVEQSLLLKAGGFIDPIVLNQLPEGESLLNWLVNKHMIQGELASLMKGLNASIESMTWNERQEHKVPSLLMLMQKSNYLIPETVDWILRESALQELKPEAFLIQNHMASSSSVETAKNMLATLENILTQHLIE